METDEIVDLAPSDLRVNLVAGGSIINVPPLFSVEGSQLFLAWKNVVRIFNVTTGEWVRDLEQAPSDIVALEFDSANPKLMVGCTEKGEIVNWKWKIGIREKTVQLKVPKNSVINTFNLVKSQEPESDREAIVTYVHSDQFVVGIFNLETGENDPDRIKDNFTALIPYRTNVSASKLNFYALVQKKFLHICYLENGKKTYHKHPEFKEFTAVACHPNEPIIATGDETGKIHLWRNIYERECVVTKYHWHSSPVSSICFSDSGSSFYSGAKEFVLVKWSVDRPDHKQFLPRIRGAPVHVAVAANNTSVAMSLSDNEIQLLNTNLDLTALIQNFTFVDEDQTGLDKFPCGLKRNPRNNTVVLNGRIGQLQFFSTNTKTLLFNLDITNENVLAVEPGKVLYNTRITKIGMSRSWLVTGECWDDQELSVLTRLKFWYFDQEKQNYSLNTNILMPHDKSLTSIEVSPRMKNDVNFCATAGGDNFVKLWSNSHEVYGKGKVWQCVGSRKYKNLPVQSMTFSSDGSVLLVGFGNAVVVFLGNSLMEIRAVLTPPMGLDGFPKQISVLLPEKGKTPNMKNKGNLKEITNQIDKLMLEETSGGNKMKEIIPLLKRANYKNELKQVENLTDDDKEQIYESIFNESDLNLKQKLNCINRLGISWDITDADPKGREDLLQQFQNEDKINNKNRQILLNPEKILSDREKFSKMSEIRKITDIDEMLSTKILVKSKANFNRNLKTIQPKRIIKSILMGIGEFSHLVIVATLNRVLIWNLLTMKLQSVLKMSIQHMDIDPISGLIAAVTENKQLFVFKPNAPIPEYRRQNMPDIYGLVWVTRRVPQSNYLDWQASSQLFFLNKKQELFCLVSESEVDEYGISSSYFDNHINNLNVNTPFGAMLAKQQQQKQQLTNGTSGNLLLKKSNVNEIINLLPHAMAPVNLLSKGYISSLLHQTADDKNEEKSRNGDEEAEEDEEKMDVDSDSDVEIISDVKSAKDTSNEVRQRNDKHQVNVKITAKLREVAHFQLDLQF